MLSSLKNVLLDCTNAVVGTLLYDMCEDVIFILPCYKEKEEVLEIIRNKLSSNFYLELNIKKTKLPYQRDSEVEKKFLECVSHLFHEPEKRLYPKLEKEIKPVPENSVSWKAIICDLCQKAQATKEFSREDTTEYLCKSCYDLRKSAPRYENLARLEETDNTKIAFVEISLQKDSLLKTLSICFNNQFNQKLREKNRGSVVPQDFGFSVIFEFLEDYIKFLSDVKKVIDSLKNKRKGIERLDILNNLFIVKISSLRDLMLLVEEYTKVYKNYFPKFVELKESPIYLNISCANIKYPFFEHWRFFEDYKQRDKRFSVFINVVNKGTMETEIWNMESLIKFYESVSRKSHMRTLHKLSEIAKFSEAFADKIMSDRKKDKSDRPSYKTYRELTDPLRPHGLDHRSLLTLAKIIGD